MRIFKCVFFGIIIRNKNPTLPNSCLSQLAIFKKTHFTIAYLPDSIKNLPDPIENLPDSIENLPDPSENLPDPIEDCPTSQSHRDTIGQESRQCHDHL